MRALWKGSLSFGLIHIPIKLYSATQDHGINFDMLHKKDLSPIRYIRICKSDGKEIPYKDIVRGYQYQKGDYVILTEEDFKHVEVKKSKSIDIIDFVDESEIDSIYYEKPYYLEPDKGADKAYILLREALKKSAKVGIAYYVFHHRGHIGVLKNYNQALILNQLRYNSEINKPAQLHIPQSTKTSQQEIAMALKLINQLSSHFYPEEYHDTYTEELKEIISEKSKGKKPNTNKAKEPKITDMKDIMRALKESLESHHRKNA